MLNRCFCHAHAHAWYVLRISPALRHVLISLPTILLSLHRFSMIIYEYTCVEIMSNEPMSITPHTGLCSYAALMYFIEYASIMTGLGPCDFGLFREGHFSCTEFHLPKSENLRMACMLSVWWWHSLAWYLFSIWKPVPGVWDPFLSVLMQSHHVPIAWHCDVTDLAIRIQFRWDGRPYTHAMLCCQKFYFLRCGLSER